MEEVLVTMKNLMEKFDVLKIQALPDLGADRQEEPERTDPFPGLEVDRQGKEGKTSPIHEAQFNGDTEAGLIVW